MIENQLFYSVHWQIKRKCQYSRHWKRLSNYPLRVLGRYNGHARKFQRWIWEHEECERELRWENIGQHMGLCSLAQSCPTLWDPMGCSHQAPLFMGFSRQEYWSGLPFPSLGCLPKPKIKPSSPASLALAGTFFTIKPQGSIRGSKIQSK